MKVELKGPNINLKYDDVICISEITPMFLSIVLDDGESLADIKHTLKNVKNIKIEFEADRDTDEQGHSTG